MKPGATLRGFLPPTMQAGLLVMIAGYADAIGFLQYRAFAGQMTGNTILLAIAIAEAGWPQAGFYLAVIGSFLIGVAISGSLVRLGYAQALALSLAAVALAICAFVTARWGALLLAFAMGAQNAAATHFGDGDAQHRVHHRRSAEAVREGAGVAVAPAARRPSTRPPVSPFSRWSGWNISPAR